MLPSAPSTFNHSVHHKPWPSSTARLSNKTPHRRDHTPARSTPGLMADDATMGDSAAVQNDGDVDEPRRQLFKELYLRSEAKIAGLFGGRGPLEQDPGEDNAAADAQLAIEDSHAAEAAAVERPPKKAARTIDEDNYDDDDDEDDEEVHDTPLKNRNGNSLPSPSKSGSSPVSSDVSPNKQLESNKADPVTAEPQSSEDARKQLEEAKKANEEAVKRSFNTLFYTLENDRMAMLEQQKLEESEKQIDAEMDHEGNTHNAHGPNGEQYGSLSNANLGASSLTLKHLINRIDLKRHQVQASDAELRSLINEVRKNRSKWASEENVNQEELYEAAEKILGDLKARTEFSTPFLTRVNKRDAPDYYNSKIFLLSIPGIHLTVPSYQTPHGLRHDDQKVKDTLLQVERRLCERFNFNLEQLSSIQRQPGSSITDQRKCHEKGGGEINPLDP